MVCNLLLIVLFEKYLSYHWDKQKDVATTSSPHVLVSWAGPFKK